MQIFLVVFVPGHLNVARAKSVARIRTERLSLDFEKEPVPAVSDHSDQPEPEHPREKRTDPAEHKKFVQAEIVKWSPIIKAAGVYAD